MTSTCDLCRGTGWIVVDKNGMEYAHRCSCPLGEMHTMKAEIANIPPRFSDSKFSNIELLNNSLSELAHSARQFVSAFPCVNNGLLLSGNPGVGKTKMLCAIANEIIDRDDIKPTVYYIDWNDLVRDLGSGESFESRDFVLIRKLVDRIKDSDLVLFDELGATEPSEYVRSKIYDVINTRYNRMRPTCFATNYNDENLSSRIGLRLFSRICEMTAKHVVYGGDYRRRK